MKDSSYKNINQLLFNLNLVKEQWYSELWSKYIFINYFCITLHNVNHSEMLIKKVMLIWLLFKLWNIIFKNIEIAILLNCSYQQPQAIIFCWTLC